ncbi:MoaD/ThiS family protein [Cyanobacterium stanieri LEGE 03274]|uniref:Molybdopterin synthase sulfur carrier subunit n=1 Tax=Cyanobacterium stanieri LEGE 03274 TaxID=1828756 RepID=A0ABR9V4B3_9CHRO|nr:MoaD/ThiS family protein [Cyanobacterium stanieri]MBE9222682.1 MoaD/ThiS family protein [Cyanobacterium stanieri LEGE 03274]
MTVTVKLFAIYQEIYQKSELTLEIPENTTVADILQEITKEKTALQPWAKITRFAVNLQFVSPNYILNSGDELAFIPPVSGG